MRLIVCIFMQIISAYVTASTRSREPAISKSMAMTWPMRKKVIESGQTVTFEDHRFNYPEERFVTLGPLGDTLVVVVTAETEDDIRIISMRKADRHEQSIYRQNLS